jgi:hypothetical protein
VRRRYVQIDGELHEVGDDYLPEPRSDIHIMGDIQPYQSQIDGSMITSRSKHREHLRRHDCIEVGNDSSLYRKPKPIESPPGLKEKIIENANRFLRRV